MPRELSLNDPLSGAEIKAIILKRIDDALTRDCTLVDDIAYAGFSLKFEAAIGFVRSRTSSTMIWGEMKEGEKVEDGCAVNADYETDSPTQAREEHDLPIPVMIQTPAGPRREKVKFAKPYDKKK